MQNEEAVEEIELPPPVPRLHTHRPVRLIRRRLLPRRPGRDATIEQYCTFYVRNRAAGLSSKVARVTDDEDCGDTRDHREDQDERDALPPVSCVVLTPILEDGAPMPYYHPAVKHLAFRYLPGLSPDLASDTAEAAEEEEKSYTLAQLRVELILPPPPSLLSASSASSSSSHSPNLNPNPNAKPKLDSPSRPVDPTDPNSRLYRTSLALLDTLHRYGWGARVHYKKRVAHDCIVPREEYQDLYLRLRERHKHLVGEWQESTDPLKHVFEVSCGIANGFDEWD